MRIVGHLDMDAFFAAIEERENSSLCGLPIVVGADPRDGKGRGVVSTANYKAREYGIHSALPISKAWRLSEAARKSGQSPATFLPVRMERYAEVSTHVMETLRRFIFLVEQASIDEAYFDLSSCESYTFAEEICRKIKAAIREEERLTASVGIGPNKLIAKIASGMHKPDGLTVVREADAAVFLAPLPVRTIPGIGPKTEAELTKIGVKTIKDMRRFSLEELRAMFGKRGLDFHDKMHGRDETPVEENYETKSIGEQETFEQDTGDSQFLVGRLQALCQDVMHRVAAEGFTHFHRAVLTVRFADFETHSRSHTLASPICDPKVLEEEATKLFVPFLDQRENPHGKLIRLLGVRVEKLERFGVHAQAPLIESG
ncbi:MAG: DNA polymerase IV [Nitrospira sp.]|nr:DNA polymerase IV [Nitrospira sp.]MDH4305573.1 DNA polymerase IV [Nitrospira sp.]MDH5193545.1 DNA polymerase IV [Nitrospira sp.]